MKFNLSRFVNNQVDKVGKTQLENLSNLIKKILDFKQLKKYYKTKKYKNSLVILF